MSINYSKYFSRSTNIFQDSRKKCIRILRKLIKKTSKLRYKELETCRITIEAFQKSSLRLCSLSLKMHSKFLETSFRISDLVRQLVKLILTAILFASNYKFIANIIFPIAILFRIVFIFISHKWGKIRVTHSADLPMNCNSYRTFGCIIPELAI